MKKFFSILLVLILGACSVPLDASKVKVRKIDLSSIDMPVKLNVPDFHVLKNCISLRFCSECH